MVSVDWRIALTGIGMLIAGFVGLAGILSCVLASPDESRRDRTMLPTSVVLGGSLMLGASLGFASGAMMRQPALGLGLGFIAGLVAFVALTGRKAN